MDDPTNSDQLPNEHEAVIQKIIADFESFLDDKKEAIALQLSKAQEQLDDIIETKKSAKQFQEELEQKKAQLDELEEVLDETKGIHNSTEAAYKAVLSNHKSISTFAEEIFGKTIKKDDGSTEKIKGLKDQLQDSYSNLEESIDALYEKNETYHIEFKARVNETLQSESEKNQKFIDTWNSSYIDLRKNIKDLLPDALTAGLSSAYEQKRKNEEDELLKNQLTFKLTIYALTGMALIPIAINITRFFVYKEPLDALINGSPSLIMLILPLYLPIVWLAYSSGLKVKLAKRLIEEYAHKETVAKTFEGLSKQIESFEDEDIATELKTKLLFNLLDISAENPGKLITDYNKSDHPVMDALDKSVKFADSLEKLSRVPGIKKLATKLSEGLDKDLREQDKKANAVLESAHPKKPEAE